MQTEPAATAMSEFGPTGASIALPAIFVEFEAPRDAYFVYFPERRAL